MTCALTQLVPVDNTDKQLMKVRGFQSIPGSVMIYGSDGGRGVGSVKACGFRLKNDCI